MSKKTLGGKKIRFSQSPSKSVLCNTGCTVAAPVKEIFLGSKLYNGKRQSKAVHPIYSL